MSYSDTGGRSDSTNQAAAHDSGFYDPDKHDNQIVAVFEDAAGARSAREALVGAGVPEAAIEVIDHVEGDAAPGASHAEDGNPVESVGDSVISAFMSLFTSDDDHKGYHTAIKQGHAMVVVRPTAQTDRKLVIKTLEASSPIDFDAKLATWRQAGYDESGAARAADRRVGRREEPQGGRVRSYVADRDGMGTGGAVTNATAGATSSGTNAPPR